MAGPDSSEDYEVSERLLAVAKALGIGEVRARWRIIRAQRFWRRLRQDLAPASRRFERQICQSCGALQSTGISNCAACGARMGTRAAATLRALGLSIPTAVSVSSALGVVMVAIYGRMILARPGQGILTWDIPTLLEFGAQDPVAVAEGQWWRLGTAIFLHIGLMHIAFNLLALAQIGPSIEELFGRGRMLFFFLLTGVLANIGSDVIGGAAVSAGASGAIMGLIGVAAGWGHRIGTAHGRSVRDQMLKWGGYTMVFGLLVHADHAAHAFGFVSGAAIGYAFNPFRLEASKRGSWNAIMGAGGALVTLLLFVLIVSPLPSSRAFAKREAGPEAGGDDDDDSDMGAASFMAWAPACDLYTEGKTAEAIERARSMYPADAEPGVIASIKDNLPAMCAALERIKDECKKIDTEGIEAAMSPGVPMDPAMREHFEAAYRRMCADLAIR